MLCTRCIYGPPSTDEFRWRCECPDTHCRHIQQCLKCLNTKHQTILKETDHVDAHRDSDRD